MALSDSEQKEVLDFVRDARRKRPSKSTYALPGDIGDTADTVYAVDGMTYDERIENAARRGDQKAIALAATVAAGKGLYKTPDKIAQATALLNEVAATNPAALQQYLATKG